MPDFERSTAPWSSPPFYALEFAEDAHLVAVATAPETHCLVLFTEPDAARAYAGALQDDDPDVGDLVLTRYDEFSELHDAISGFKPEVRQILWNPIFPAETNDVTGPEVIVRELRENETVANWHTPTAKPGKAELLKARK